MSHQVVGAAAAVGAAMLYSTAVALQAVEARRVHSRHALRVSLLHRLAQRPLWLLGAASGVLGWCLQAVALGYAPLTLVEPILATTLVFLLVISTLGLGEHVTRRDGFAVLAVAAGVAGVGLGAPHHSSSHAGATHLVVALACLTAVVAAPHVLTARRSPGALVASSAGVAYACVALATKFGSDDLSGGDRRGAAGWLVFLVVLGVVGALSEMSALQSWPVTQVAPIVFGLNVLVPVVLAPLLAGEAWHRTGRVTLPIALVLLTAGVVAVSRSDAIAAVLKSDVGVERLTPQPRGSGG